MSRNACDGENDENPKWGYRRCFWQKWQIWQKCTVGLTNIQTGCHKWPLGEWQFWQKWRFWRKFAKDAAKLVMFCWKGPLNKLQIWRKICHTPLAHPPHNTLANPPITHLHTPHNTLAHPPITHLHTPPHNTPYLPPKIFHNLCFPFLLHITAVPREIENNAYAKFWGANKVHYGQCASGIWVSQNIQIR